jgi:outer membrane lipoprotein LolB
MLTFSGCSTIKPTAPTSPSIPPKATWATRQAALNRIQNWHLNGKIAVRSSHDSGSASLDWLQNQHRYTISLQGPLGSGAMKLSGIPHQVTLQTSDGKSYHASSPEQLLATQWGFHLPVSSMNYWIRGLPVPGISASTGFDQSGRLSTLIQQGYRVDFLAYTNTGKMDLPEKLSITSPSLTVKIIVYQWHV